MRGHLYIFVLVLIVSSLCFIFRELIKPTAFNPEYNVNFLPEVKIKDVKNSNVTKCLHPLIACRTTNDCTSKCGADEGGITWDCTEVSSLDNKVVNGVKVKEGKWCLPKDNSDGCGTFTGRAVWSSTSEGQRWTCQCLYPDLFTGPSCMDQIACVSDSQDVVGSDQTNNKLKCQNLDGDKCNGVVYWDPSKDNFDPKQTTPYDVDNKGDPVFACECAQNRITADNINTVIVPNKTPWPENPYQFALDPNKPLFVKLPNDPYRCHAEPCTDAHNLALWNPKAQQCDCTQGGQNLDMFAHSNTTGKCYDMNFGATSDIGWCGQGRWNSAQNRCTCDGDEHAVYSQTCESDLMKRKPTCFDPKTKQYFPMPDSKACADGHIEVPEYSTAHKCPNNPGGSICAAPCSTFDGQAKCENGKICTVIEGPNTGDCNCHPDVIWGGDTAAKNYTAALLQEGFTIDELKKEAQDSQNSNLVYYGENCSNSCFLGGTDMSTYNSSGNTQVDMCCSRHVTSREVDGQGNVTSNGNKCVGDQWDMNSWGYPSSVTAGKPGCGDYLTYQWDPSAPIVKQMDSEFTAGEEIQSCPAPAVMDKVGAWFVTNYVNTADEALGLKPCKCADDGSICDPTNTTCPTAKDSDGNFLVKCYSGYCTYANTIPNKSCSSSSDCDADNYCLNNVCYPITNFASCKTSSDCHGNTTCTNVSISPSKSICT